MGQLREFVNKVGISKDEKILIAKYFRAVAGSQLSQCGKDNSGILEGQGIYLGGTDEALTEQFLVDAIILASAEQGSDIYLSTPRALKIAEKRGMTVNLDGVEEVFDWLCGAVGVESDGIEDSGVGDEFDDTLDDEEDGTWDDDEEDVDEGEPEVYEEEEKASTEGTDEKDVSDDEIYRYYYQYCKGAISELVKRYTVLFESGYEVVHPVGLLCGDGIVGLSGNKRVEKYRTVSTRNMEQYLQQEIGYVEIDCRSTTKIINTIFQYYRSGRRDLLYFPNKLLEFAFGRKKPEGKDKDSLNTYEPHANASSWSAYCNQEVDKSLMDVIKTAVIYFIRREMETRNVKYDDFSIADELNAFLSYVQSCLSTCLLMVEYKCTETEVANFKVRICDPTGKILYKNLTSGILGTAFMGATGDVPFTYEPRVVAEVNVVEYSHEFNHDISQASPLFAYKACQALQNQGVNPDWNNLILGKFEDGSILKNGKKGVNLSNALTHFISAGSRAGKGVMTLNFLNSAVYSNKPIFYLDRKPDMGSMLRSLSNGMFIVNGGGYDENYDEYKSFTGIDRMVNWSNTPEYLVELLKRGKTWNELGDLFYMRALKLILGILVARGSGSSGDELLGGKDGIVIIVDEFKNLQQSYNRIIKDFLNKVPPVSYLKDKAKLPKEMEKDPSAESRFNVSYNNGSYYALSYLNSMVEDLKYLSIKRDAGFDQEEGRASDIFVIGQSLEYGDMNGNTLGNLLIDGSSSARYKSSGGVGLKDTASKAIGGEDSIPFSMVSFKSCDAFFGRNMEDGRSTYLAQESRESKACGRLDDKAGNFAYMKTFNEDIRRRVTSGNIRDNITLANSCIYFKPFLVLNDAKPGDRFTENMFARCAGNPEHPWVTREEIIADNPNADGSFLHEAVGFEGYLRMMGVSDYPERLSRSGQIAEYVVRECLGYNGSWFDFVTDLRPQSLFCIEDVVNSIAAKRKGESWSKISYDKSPILSEFARFNPELFGLDGSISEDFDTDNLLEEDGYDTDFGDEFEQEENYSNDMNDVFEEAEAKARAEEIFAEEEEFDENEEIDMFYEDLHKGRDYGSGFKEGNGTYTSNDVEAFVKEMLSNDELLETLRKMGVNVQVDDKWKKENFQSEGHFGKGVYTGADGDAEEFDIAEESILINENIPRNTGNILETMVQLITEDVLTKFGGVNNITSFKVVGGSIIVNRHCYTCKINKEYATMLPYDIRCEVNSGNISRLFDYSVLLECGRLRDLEFDSASLVYDYVGEAFGWGKRISVDRFFDDIRSLQVVTIGRKKFSRDKLKEQLANEDVFYKPRLSARMFESSVSLLDRAGNASWGFTKDVARRKDYGAVKKVVGVGGGLVATAGAKVVSTGLKGIRAGIKGISSAVGEMINNTKNMK